MSSVQSQVTAALEKVFRTPTGDPMSGAQIARLLTNNMDKLEELVRQGRLTQEQIIQVRVTSFILVSIQDTRQ